METGSSTTTTTKSQEVNDQASRKTGNKDLPRVSFQRLPHTERPPETSQRMLPVSPLAGSLTQEDLRSECEVLSEEDLGSLWLSTFGTPLSHPERRIQEAQEMQAGHTRTQNEQQRLSAQASEESLLLNANSRRFRYMPHYDTTRSQIPSPASTSSLSSTSQAGTSLLPSTPSAPITSPLAATPSSRALLAVQRGQGSSIHLARFLGSPCPSPPSTTLPARPPEIQSLAWNESLAEHSHEFTALASAITAPSSEEVKRSTASVISPSDSEGMLHKAGVHEGARLLHREAHLHAMERGPHPTPLNKTRLLELPAPQGLAASPHRRVRDNAQSDSPSSQSLKRGRVGATVAEGAPQGAEMSHVAQGHWLSGMSRYQQHQGMPQVHIRRILSSGAVSAMSADERLASLHNNAWHHSDTAMLGRSSHVSFCTPSGEGHEAHRQAPGEPFGMQYPSWQLAATWQPYMVVQQSPGNSHGSLRHLESPTNRAGLALSPKAQGFGPPLHGDPDNHVQPRPLSNQGYWAYSPDLTHTQRPYTAVEGSASWNSAQAQFNGDKWHGSRPLSSSPAYSNSSWPLVPTFLEPYPSLPLLSWASLPTPEHLQSCTGTFCHVEGSHWQAQISPPASQGLPTPGGSEQRPESESVKKTLLRSASVSGDLGVLQEEGGEKGKIPPPQFQRWTAEEDTVLLDHVRRHGTRQWSMLRQSGKLPGRDNKACCNRFLLLKRQHRLQFSGGTEERKLPVESARSAPEGFPSEGTGDRDM